MMKLEVPAEMQIFHYFPRIVGNKFKWVGRHA